MNSAVKILKIISIIIFALISAICSEKISESIVTSINICINVIIPSMFIFMVISTYILSSGLYKVIFSPFYYILKKILRLDNELFSVFLLSLIGGYPIGIKLLSELISQNKNYSAIAEKSSGFLYCISPSFAITMLGLGLYRSFEAGMIIYLSNVISCFLTAIICSRVFDLKLADNNMITTSYSGIIDAVNSSSKTLLKICSIIVFFNSIITVFECLLNYSGFELPETIKSILEISNILRIKEISVSSLPLVSALASFGGICVLIQCLALVKGRYSLKYFFLLRFFNAVLSFLITHIIMNTTEISVPAFAANNKISVFNFSHQGSACVFLLIMFIIFMQKSEKNFKKG